ncbi:MULTISPECIES: hypothetical protein [Nocardia]|uniref:hypothetical protein n=1 Tax=Nocardia TaxID=1817 RepID=UPI000FDC5329|nr:MULTISPECIES: hypothetical protein [Nocardia]MBF6189277.1 hypothetical protein [Nocardia farcinica]MBF6246360.1 hypothetical protein [Nocardia elegans]MBF6314989.1 hypothetical protein [Nocardia farcinica]MBF6411151.1 hypothetical protein [Nocardia farcinica]UEX26299.1 hypothetical protein LMJ57_30595 [Nocardia farcinica]
MRSVIWVVTLRYSSAEIDREELTMWEEELADVDATAGRLPGVAVMLSVYIEAEDPVEAAGLAAALVRPVTGLSPVAVEVVDEETHFAEADAPNLPQLVSAAEVADELEVSRQRVHQLQGTVGFPEPLYRLRTGPVWDARAIKAFASRWDRRPGRRGADAKEPESPSPRSSKPTKMRGSSTKYKQLRVPSGKTGAWVAGVSEAGQTSRRRARKA